jgi:antitoxin VapB
MPLNIRDEEVNRLAGELARRTNRTKTDAVKQALSHELERLDKAVPLWERLRPIQDRIAAWPSTGLEADKAFYDELNGDP